MNTIEIRHAVSADEPQWRDMWKAYNDFYGAHVIDSVTAKTWARILDPKSTIQAIVAQHEQTVVGFANYVVHPYTWGEHDICYLEDLFTRPESRGQGIGRALIANLREMAKEEHWERIYWMTKTDNHVARALYDTFCEADDFVRYVIPTNSG